MSDFPQGTQFYFPDQILPEWMKQVYMSMCIMYQGLLILERDAQIFCTGKSHANFIYSP